MDGGKVRVREVRDVARWESELVVIGNCSVYDDG